MAISDAQPSALPLYRQVKDILVGRIARGEWRPGTMIPSEPRLAAELGVSPGTVRKALDEMAAESLVRRRQGRGTFVETTTGDARLFHFFKFVDRAGNPVMPEATELDRKTSPAPREAREALRLGPADAVLTIERLRSFGHSPVMLETVTLPLKLFPALKDTSEPLPRTLYDLYETRFGITIRRVDERVTAAMATEAEADALDMQAGAALLVVRRLAFTFDRRPVELRVFRIDPLRIEYLNVIE